MALVSRMRRKGEHCRSIDNEEGIEEGEDGFLRKKVVDGEEEDHRRPGPRLTRTESDWRAESMSLSTRCFPYDTLGCSV